MKYATRAEILENNPFLKRFWLSRVLAGSIISGARMSETDWKKMRFSFFSCIFTVFLFGFILAVDDVSYGERAVMVSLVLFSVLGIFLTGAVCYGYINRDKIDSSGAFKMDTRSIWPVASLCAGATVGGGALLTKIFGAC